MHQNQLSKFFILAFLFFSSESQAQNPEPSQAAAPAASTFSESSLPDKTKTSSETALDPKNAKSLMRNSTLIDKVSSSVAEILLGNKLTSLMFDEEENSNIDRAVESLKNNRVYSPDGSLIENSDEEKTDQEKIEENEKSYLYLASIIYFTPKDWAIWVNSEKITPDNNKKEKELYVRELTMDSVRFLWKLSISKWKILSGKTSEELAPKINKQNQVEVEFTLKQNQTYILGTGSIVEGKAVIALLKKRAEEKKAAEEAKNKAATSDANNTKPIQ